MAPGRARRDVCRGRRRVDDDAAALSEVRPRELRHEEDEVELVGHPGTPVLDRTHRASRRSWVRRHCCTRRQSARERPPPARPIPRACSGSLRSTGAIPVIVPPAAFNRGDGFIGWAPALRSHPMTKRTLGGEPPGGSLSLATTSAGDQCNSCLRDACSYEPPRSTPRTYPAEPDRLSCLNARVARCASSALTLRRNPSSSRSPHDSYSCPTHLSGSGARRATDDRPAGRRSARLTHPGQRLGSVPAQACAERLRSRPR